MEKQIKETHNKIIKFIKANFNNDGIYNELDLQLKSRSIEAYSKQNKKELAEIFDKRRTDIRIIEKTINECKEIAKDYHDAHLFVAENAVYKLCVFITYWETPQDILNRLNKEYDRLVKDVKDRAKRRHELYLKLKKEFD